MAPIFSAFSLSSAGSLFTSASSHPSPKSVSYVYNNTSRPSTKIPNACGGFPSCSWIFGNPRGKEFGFWKIACVAGISTSAFCEKIFLISQPLKEHLLPFPQWPTLSSLCQRRNQQLPNSIFFVLHSTENAVFRKQASSFPLSSPSQSAWPFPLDFFVAALIC